MAFRHFERYTNEKEIMVKIHHSKWTSDLILLILNSSTHLLHSFLRVYNSHGKGQRRKIKNHGQQKLT